MPKSSDDKAPSPAKKSPAKKAATKKAATKKTAVKKAAAKKTPTKKTVTPKTPAKKTAKKATQQTTTIDNIQKVENPAVRAAMEAYEKEDTDAVKTQLMHALNDANFLAVVLTDEIEISEIAEDGTTNIQPGSKFKPIILRDNKGATIFPLFTDWEAIRAFMSGSEKPHCGFVIPSAQAWDIILRSNYSATLINPGGKSLPLVPQQVKFLQDHMTQA